MGGLRICTLMVFGITVGYGAKGESEQWRSCVQLDVKRSMQMSNRPALSTGSAAEGEPDQAPSYFGWEDKIATLLEKEGGSKNAHIPAVHAASSKV